MSPMDKVGGLLVSLPAKPTEGEAKHDEGEYQELQDALVLLHEGMGRGDFKAAARAFRLAVECCHTSPSYEEEG